MKRWCRSCSILSNDGDSDDVVLDDDGLGLGSDECEQVVQVLKYWHEFGGNVWTRVRDITYLCQFGGAKCAHAYDTVSIRIRWSLHAVVHTSEFGGAKIAHGSNIVPVRIRWCQHTYDRAFMR